MLLSWWKNKPCLRMQVCLVNLRKISWHKKRKHLSNSKAKRANSFVNLLFFLALRGHSARISTHSAVLEAMTGRSLIAGYELSHCKKLMGAIATLRYAQLYNCLKSVDMLNKCKRLNKRIHAVLHRCFQLSPQSQIPEDPVLSNHRMSVAE